MTEIKKMMTVERSYLKGALTKETRQVCRACSSVLVILASHRFTKPILLMLVEYKRHFAHP